MIGVKEVLWCENDIRVHLYHKYTLYKPRVLLSRVENVDRYSKMHQLTWQKETQIWHFLKQCVINVVAFVFAEQPLHH